MAQKYKVTVAPGYRWPRAKIAGREFAKNAMVTLAEHEFSDEIARAATEEYGILEIKVVRLEDSIDIDATDGARALAEAEGVNLAEIGGSGTGGRIVKRDVEAYLAWMEEVTSG